MMMVLCHFTLQKFTFYILPVFTVIVSAFGAIPEKSNNKRPLLWQNYIFFKVYILS